MSGKILSPEPEKPAALKQPALKEGVVGYVLFQFKENGILEPEFDGKFNVANFLFEMELTKVGLTNRIFMERMQNKAKEEQVKVQPANGSIKSPFVH
jgi:hypothetical protein